MTPEAFVAALSLPPQTMVNQRVPKKLLIDNGAATTTTDKRLIQDSIEDLTWVAALKPDTIGISAYRDDTREYLELAVLTMTLRSDVNLRLFELVHRAIPYPLLLTVTAPTTPLLTLSLAHIRWAQREADRTVLDGPSVQVSVPDSPIGQAFIQALALLHQPRAHLLDLYQGWLDTVTALQVAGLTGRFGPITTPEAAANCRALLHQCQELNANIAQLCAQALKEKQLPRQVELNLHIRAAKSKLDQLMEYANCLQSAP